MLVGECVPASCDAVALSSLLAASETESASQANAAGLSASFVTLNVRPVPGSYNVLADFKFQIVG